MVKNYYKILGIPTTSSLLEIQEGYKRAILKWHPKKTKVPLEQASKEFAEASEAYEVLSTSNLRAVYDAYGYDILHSGIKKNEEILFVAYEFKSTPDQVYRKYSLEANPFAEIIDKNDSKCIGSMFGSSALGKNWENRESPIDIHQDLECTLEEFFFGCSKTIKFTRMVLNHDRKTTHSQLILKDILIKPGYYQGMELIYKGEGSEKTNNIKGDLIVHIKEKKHEKYIRDGNDIHVTVTLALHEALSTSSICIENVCRTVKMISIDRCISPQDVIVLEGQGMFILDSEKRGNLCVHFNIVFPERIPEARLEELRALLPGE